MATSMVGNLTAIEAKFRERTPKSAALIERSSKVMPGGVTRGFGFHFPYPAVMERGEGCHLWDVDGNQYIDLINNGLALIHGHAFKPVVDALTAQLPQGWAWLGTSQPQIEFAEAICKRIPTCERVLYTNSGTESGMLAVKLARHYTGKPLILKLRAGYHGSYSDLEAGLEDRGEIPGHTLLAEFNDLDSFRHKLEQYKGQIAAVIVEPVMYTGTIMIPEDNFLYDLQELTRSYGVLFIVDDCLMLRLAYGGSAEKFGLTPDLTFLGKFLGGGTPMGATGGRADILDITDPHRPDVMYHGGSYNGNVLSALAAKITLDNLTRERIAVMDAHALALAAALRERAAQLRIPMTVAHIGSILGVFFTDEKLIAGGPIPNPHLAHCYHLACVNNGVHLGPGCVMALTTAIDNTAIAQVIAAMTDALDQVAA